MRRRYLCPDRLGGNSSQRVLIQRDSLDAKHTPEAGILESLLQPGLRIGERDIVQINRQK